MRHLIAQLFRFAWQQGLSCIFAVGIFVGLLFVRVVPLPIDRYDALLIWCLVLTLGFWAIGLETWREVLVIFAFHALGLTLEIFTVHQGSWLYPGDATLQVAGVPLFSGFMYAAVGSYICQSWRRLDLRVSRYRPLPTTLVAIGIYANFFTHHYIVDLRLVLAAALVVVLWHTRVHYTVGVCRYWMPLSLSFLFIGTFLWLAENAATFLDAWNYPGQVDVWEAVHASKLGSWALLVSMSFVLVATVKAQEGRLYHVPGEPHVTR